MNFLDPRAIAIAAGLTIPPLIALYFLKLKRQPRPVASTLLWKKAIEDLRVNAPFQRLRASLLLLLQLLALAAAAVALGKPMWQSTERREDTLILLIDQSASMDIAEPSGRTRLDLAKEQARRAVDSMDEASRAMVIAFADRANVVSSFDTDRAALKRKIDGVEPTQAGTRLSEALSLAEAYAQNLIIGTETGQDISPDANAPPASVMIFTDGRVADADRVTLEKFDAERIHVAIVGETETNVGIVAMDARRHYERPQVLEVTAVVGNFAERPVSLDATLYVDGRALDVKTVALAGATAPPPPAREGGAPKPEAPSAAPTSNAIPPNPADASPSGAAQAVAFDAVEFEGGGVVEVVLRVDDALSADNRAWAVIDAPRRSRVLLVSEGNPVFDPLGEVLAVLPLDVTRMTPADYESAGDDRILYGTRSAFDVVIFDGCSSARLPHGNYMYWGESPRVPGVATGDVVTNEIIFNWDETHPILRHVSVDAMKVHSWRRLTLPSDAARLVEGNSSPVVAYLARQASQHLMIAFQIVTRDDQGQYIANSPWYSSADFIVFVSNAVQFLASNVAITGKRSLAPGETATLAVPPRAERIDIRRPDGRVETVETTGRPFVPFADTPRVGVYQIESEGRVTDRFTVNLFDRNESDVRPAKALTLGANRVETRVGELAVNRPAWQYALLALLGLLVIEWIVYNRRVFV